MQLNVFLFSLYTPVHVEKALRSQQLWIVMFCGEHLAIPEHAVLFDEAITILISIDQ